MVDRQKLEVLLGRRFPGGSLSQIAATANSIMGLEDDWETVDGLTQDELRHHFSIRCGDFCSLACQDVDQVEFRLLRRRAR